MSESALALVDPVGPAVRRIDGDALERAVADLLCAALRGAVRDDARTRQRFLTLTRRTSHD